MGSGLLEADILLAFGTVFEQLLDIRTQLFLILLQDALQPPGLFGQLRDRFLLDLFKGQRLPSLLSDDQSHGQFARRDSLLLGILAYFIGHGKRRDGDRLLLHNGSLRWDESPLFFLRGVCGCCSRSGSDRRLLTDGAIDHSPHLLLQFFLIQIAVFSDDGAGDDDLCLPRRHIRLEIGVSPLDQLFHDQLHITADRVDAFHQFPSCLVQPNQLHYPGVVIYADLHAGVNIDRQISHRCCHRSLQHPLPEQRAQRNQAEEERCSCKRPLHSAHRRYFRLYIESDLFADLHAGLITQLDEAAVPGHDDGAAPRYFHDDPCIHKGSSLPTSSGSRR